MACSVRRAGSGFTSRVVGVGLSDSDSDLFGVGLASRTAVPLASASLFGVQAAVQSDRIIVRWSSCWVSSKRIIVRSRPSFPVGTSCTLNYCSLQTDRVSCKSNYCSFQTAQRPIWVLDSDFTIVRYSDQILEQRVLTLVSFPPSLVFFRTIVRFYPV